MQVSELINLLPDSAYSYRGTQNLPFTGLALDAPKNPQHGRFLITHDSSWPETTMDPEIPSRKRIERLLQRAFARGMSGAICSTEFLDAAVLEGKNVFFTDDTFTLGCQIAGAVRHYSEHQHITAITGSVGKTTTKAMLVHALNAVGVRRLLSTPGNKNLHRTLLRRLSQSHRYNHTVLEVSSLALQAFRTSGFSLSPDVGIVTSITEAHLEYMSNLENLAQVKSDVFQSPPPGGTAIINRDTEHADLLIRRAVSEGCQLVTYGETAEATIRLCEWDPQTRQAVVALGQERIEYTLGSAGKHIALNSLAIIGALRAHRIRDWRIGVQSLADFAALEGRGRIVRVQLPSGVEVTVVDEAYNANPASIRSSLNSLGSTAVAQGARRVAVLGDALELGERADEFHRDLADAVLTADIDQVFLFGQHMHALYSALKGCLDSVRYWADLDSMRDELLDLLEQNDIVLMKGSLGTGLQGFVKEITTVGMSHSN